MHDKVVLDSSLIAAIFFPEPISGKAIDIAAAHDCITIDLAYPEVANVAWKRAVHAGNDPELVKDLLDTATSFIREACEVLPSYDLINPAWDLACRHRITMYDALFIAASVRCGTPLATADRKLSAVAGSIGPAILVEE